MAPALSLVVNCKSFWDQITRSTFIPHFRNSDLKENKKHIVKQKQIQVTNQLIKNGWISQQIICCRCCCCICYYSPNRNLETQHLSNAVLNEPLRCTINLTSQFLVSRVGVVSLWTSVLCIDSFLNDQPNNWVNL